MGRHRLACAAVMLALLSACGPGENDPGPGGVTVGEAKALDEAAEMLEERKLPPEALDPSPQPEAGEAAAADAAPTEQLP
ncbi:hypothetical protein LY632_03605 [Erythrobacter sp. SDW2]|uniref:hypothetical protein n=1 Tax=Erythrobacter sp. SDW2 TaxID=2907154 RepID=UPI001F42E263|nr:hypothetical protein [Erythrobacter sp. SDW2]UIP07495.1 hypothetical protein LY632_03605 [Erythrobacter sp. SDW2]